MNKEQRQTRRFRNSENESGSNALGKRVGEYFRRAGRLNQIRQPAQKVLAAFE
jgi:hypothetical protein